MRFPKLMVWEVVERRGCGQVDRRQVRHRAEGFEPVPKRLPIKSCGDSIGSILAACLYTSDGYAALVMGIDLTD